VDSRSKLASSRGPNGGEIQNRDGSVQRAVAADGRNPALRSGGFMPYMPDFFDYANATSARVERNTARATRSARWLDVATHRGADRTLLGGYADEVFKHSSGMHLEDGPEGCEYGEPGADVPPETTAARKESP